LAPANSMEQCAAGNLTLLGTRSSEIDLNTGGPASAALLNVNGRMSVTNATLSLPLLNTPVGFYPNGTYLIAANDGVDPITGTFASITGLPAGYSATVNYAFSGTDSIGRTGDGHDLAVCV